VNDDSGSFFELFKELRCVVIAAVDFEIDYTQVRIKEK